MTSNEIKNIRKLSEQVDTFFTKECLVDAIDLYNKAWDLIPEPKEEYEITELIASNLGEALFELDDFEEARFYFERAYATHDGWKNPFVLLMLGRCWLELGNIIVFITYVHFVTSVLIV